MWEAAGGRVSGALAGYHAVAVLGDDPAATGAVAMGVARAQARVRRVFVLDLLGDGQGVATPGPRDDYHGVSDMVRFGVSLAKVARPVAGTPNLHLVSGGAESPLTTEILTSRWWSVVAAQVRRANALLLVAAPSMVPAMASLLSRLDGVLLVGDAAPPDRETEVLAEVRAASALRTSPTGARAVRAAPPAQRPQWRIAALVAAVVVAGAALTAPQWRPLLGLAGEGATLPPASGLPDIPPPQQASAAPSLPPTNEASFSVELLFTNSDQDALEYLGQSSDSLPAATFAPVVAGVDPSPWYRLVAGAFPDSSTADTFLQVLRQSGRVSVGGGAVARTPFALLLDSASSDALAQVRVSAYRGRGIPAYVLRDSVSTWRVYAGAFPTEPDAQWLKLTLDSLNIQSVLVTRTGSTP